MKIKIMEINTLKHTLMDYLNSTIDSAVDYSKQVVELAKSKFGDMASSSAPMASSSAPMASSSEPMVKTVVVAPVTAASVTFDFSSYIVKVIIGIYLVNKIVPPGDSYKNLKIMMYVLVVLGGGYPLFFLILLWLFKMQITKK